MGQALACLQTLTQAMSLTLGGLALGSVLAFALTQVLTSLLYEISATDPFTSISIPLLLGVVALMACYVPASKAAKVDPMAALRDE